MSEQNQKLINELYQLLKSKEVITQDEKNLIQKTYLDPILTDKTIPDETKQKIVNDVQQTAIAKSLLGKEILDKLTTKTIIKEEENDEDDIDNIDVSQFAPNNPQQQLQQPQEQTQQPIQTQITKQKEENEIDEKEFDNFNDNVSDLSELNNMDLSQYYSLTSKELQKKLLELYPSNPDTKLNRKQGQRRYRLKKRILEQKRKDLKGNDFEEEEDKKEVEIVESDFKIMLDTIIKLQNEANTKIKYTREELMRMSKPTIQKILEQVNEVIDREFSDSVQNMAELNIMLFGVAESFDYNNKLKLKGMSNELQIRKKRLLGIYEKIIKEHIWMKEYIGPTVQLGLLFAECYGSAQGNNIKMIINNNLNNPPILKKNP